MKTSRAAAVTAQAQQQQAQDLADIKLRLEKVEAALVFLCELLQPPDKPEKAVVETPKARK